MNFVAIFNNDVLSCSTDRLVLTKDEFSELEKIEDLTSEIICLRDTEVERISKSESNGYQAGYSDGIHQGLSDLNKQFREYLKDLTENIYINNIESDEFILNLAVEVIKKIASEIGNEDMIKSIASTAIQKLKQSNHLEVKVNPKYADQLKLDLKKIDDSNTYAFSSLDIIADASLGELDCIIKTESGTTVASFEEQLNILRDQFNAKTQI